VPVPSAAPFAASTMRSGAAAACAAMPWKRNLPVMFAVELVGLSLLRSAGCHETIHGTLTHEQAAAQP